MIFPIGDDQVKGGFFPLFSYLFIGLNVAIFIFQFISNPQTLLVCEFGSIPGEILRGEDLYTLFTSMFMHGGWMHLIGNMLFLWVFADNIEATLGPFIFVCFYLLGGLAATGAHIFIGAAGADLAECCRVCADPPCLQGMTACAKSIPSVGASGAIAAVLGAYLLMFPRSKVKLLVLYFMQSFKIPAIFFLGFWIAQQLFSGVQASLPGAESGGVAWWAHIGGFAFGVLFGLFFRNDPRVKAARSGKVLDGGKSTPAKGAGDNFV